MPLQKIKLSFIIMLLSMGVVNFIDAQMHCKVLIFIYPDLCDNGMVVLHAEPHPTLVPPFTFLWSNGETTQDITVPQGSGTYSIAVTDANGCYAVYSVTLDNPALTEYFIEQFNGCANEQIYFGINWGILTAPEDVSYNWSTGENTEVATIPGPGTYYVTITDVNTGCFVVLEHTAVIYPSPDVEISGPTNLCPGQSGILVAEGGPFNQYTWSEGLTTPTLEIFGPGIYWVQVTNDFYCSDIAEITVSGGGATVTLSQPTPICNNESTTIEVLNANDFTSFLWSNGETSSSINVNSPGIYAVVATDASGCTGEAAVEVSTSSLDITAVVTPNTSCNLPNGAIDIAVNPIGTFSFLWNNGAVTEDLTSLNAGNYSVIVTDVSGCSATQDFTVSLDVTPITIDFNAVNPSCGQNNGSIDLMISPAGSYVYNWSNGANTEDLNNVGEASYFVTVTGANGCFASTTITLINNNVNFNITASITPITSCSNANGSIDVSVNPNGTYTYLWSNGSTNEDLMNLTEGTYSIVVSDVNGCSSSDEFIVTANVTSPEISFNAVNSLCGQNNGSIDLTISPSGNNSFLWNSGEVTEDLIDLAAGNYFVTVTDANGCTSSSEIVINNTDFDITLFATTNPLTSCTTPNGTIDLSYLPSGMYSFTWTNGATTEDLIGLGAGTYTVTVTHTNGCATTGEYSVDAAMNLPQISSTIVNPICNQNNGSIDVSIMPAGNYTYVWSNSSSTQDLNNINAGVYSVVATDANGCSTSASFTLVNTNNAFTVTANITANSSCSNANGAIDVSVLPAGSYTYLWGNGSTSEDISNLTSATYTVIVSDANSCSSAMDFVVPSQTNTVAISFTSINPSCGQNNGNIDALISPSGNYTYAWSNGGNTEDLFSVGSGSYVLVVSDANGCTSSATTTLVNTNNNFSISGVVTDHTSCINANGSIDLTINPIGNYSFIWSNGNNAEDINNVVAGTYNVMVTDVVGCSSSMDFVVASQTNTANISFTTINPVCGKNNGSIDALVSPSGNYSYAWSNGGNTEDLSSVGAGGYVLIVSDANGCTSSGTTILVNNNNNFSISADITENTSCTIGNGAIDVTVNPAGNYSYFWSNGSASQDLSNANEGIYTVVVADGNGCSSSMEFQIPSAKIIPSVTYTYENPSCGKNNGSIDATISPAGSYTYLWSNGEFIEDIFSLEEGSYSLIVTSDKGCSTLTTVDLVNKNNNFSINGVTTANSSCTSGNGAIDITLNPIEDYTYQWSTGSGVEDINNLTEGNYEVLITDKNGCQESMSFEVIADKNYPAVTFTSVNPSCGQDNGSIDVMVSPSGNYTYIWSNGDNVEDLNAVGVGGYDLIVTDADGCSTSSTTELTNINNNFTITANTTSNTSCTVSNGAINLSINPIGTYTFEWSNGNTSEDINSAASGMYTVMVTDGSGCSDIKNYTIAEKAEIPVVDYELMQPNCRQYEGAVQFSSTSTPTLMYAINNSDDFLTLPTKPLYLDPGIYQFTIINDQQCIAQFEIEINSFDKKFTIFLSPEETMNIGDEITLDVNLQGINIDDVDSVLWTPTTYLQFDDNDVVSQLHPHLIVQEAAMYSVVVHSEGCMDSASIRISMDLQGIYTPNIISTSSNTNNSFYITGNTGVIKNIDELRIYDRWGNAVFTNKNLPPNDATFGWNGTLNNTAAEQGVYVWAALITLSNGDKIRLHGDVTLVR